VLKYLRLAEFFDSVGEFNFSDKLMKISQDKYKNIKTADVNHWTKFTNFEQVLKAVIHFNRTLDNYPDTLKKDHEYPCGELETTVDGEQIKISVFFNPSEDGAYFDLDSKTIVIGDIWYPNSPQKMLVHEINHAYEDILEVKKVGEITRTYEGFDYLSQFTWSEETVNKARKYLFPGKRSKKIIEMLDDSFDEKKIEIEQKIFKNKKIIEQPEYWEKIVDKKLPQDLRQSIINDLKRMTLGRRDYYRIPAEVRSRLSEILYTLSTNPKAQEKLLQAKPKKFEEYFKEVLGRTYLFLTPEQRKYILNNVYQSLRGGRQQTILNKIINSTQDGIKRGLLPKNIGQMYPVQIKQLINENPEIKQFISVMRGNSGISDSELINLIKQVANNQIQTQTTTNSGTYSYNDALEQNQSDPNLDEPTIPMEQKDSQSEQSEFKH
jgi:hypothetical protein